MLSFRAVRHAYDAAPVIAELTLDVPRGRVTGLIGPSGCGKTTTLHLAAGLLRPTGGRIDNRFARPALVFQEPRLLRWQSAVDNAAFGLKAVGLKTAERRAEAARLLTRLGLEPAQLTRLPGTLSGGMRQRVALARAFAVGPDLLLLDEPFAGLDIGLRRTLQALVRELIDERNVTGLVVTHAIVDALRLCDRIAILAPAPSRVVCTLAIERPAGARDEAYLHETAASLLRRPEVVAAFAGPSQ